MEAALDAIEPPWDPLERAALDGFLAAVALQPAHRRPRDAQEWARWIVDPDAGSRRGLKSAAATALVELATQRLAHLDAAIESRQWFDPWVDAPDPDDVDSAADSGGALPAHAVRPWVSGFSLAAEAFGDLMDLGDPDLLEPHALLYGIFEPDELEDVPAELAEAIEELEPAATLDEAVEDVVAAVLLISDVTRPATRRAAVSAPAGRGPSKRPARRG